MIDYRIHRSSTFARGVVPGAFTVVEANVTVEADAQIGPLCYIAAGVTLGAGAVIGAHAVILANVPAGAVVEPGAIWNGESERAAADVLDAPRKRGRPRKVGA